MEMWLGCVARITTLSRGAQAPHPLQQTIDNDEDTLLNTLSGCLVAGGLQVYCLGFRCFSHIGSTDTESGLSDVVVNTHRDYP